MRAGSGANVPNVVADGRGRGLGDVRMLARGGTDTGVVDTDDVDQEELERGRRWVMEVGAK